MRLNPTNHFLLLYSPFVRILPPFTTISITGSGSGALLERFPGARRAVASRAVVNMMKEQSPEALKPWWQERLPGQIPVHLLGNHHSLGPTARAACTLSD
jgi:hypothetical protein